MKKINYWIFISIFLLIVLIVKHFLWDKHVISINKNFSKQLLVNSEKDLKILGQIVLKFVKEKSFIDFLNENNINYNLTDSNEIELNRVILNLNNGQTVDNIKFKWKN